MIEKKEISNITKLSDRASNLLEIKEVYLKKQLYLETIQFLEKQKLLPIQNIKKIFNITDNEYNPIGSVMLDKKTDKIVGFVGTIYSSRKIEDKKFNFCNIHSWIVDKNYRLYSFFLISDLLKKKEINLTAFTPILTLRGMLLKLGFTKFLLEEVFFVNFRFFKINKTELKISQNHSEFILNFDEKNQKIFNECSDKIFHRVCISDSNNDKFFLIGTISNRKIFKVFKILYISNYEFYRKKKRQIIRVISDNYNINFFSYFFFRNSANFINERNFFSYRKRKDIYIRSKKNIDFHEILNSDLVL